MTPSLNARPKTSLRQLGILVAAVLAVGMLLDVGGAFCETKPPDEALRSTIISPRHVSIKDADLKRTFIAGEKGQLRLTLQIVNPIDSDGLSLRWLSGQEPAVVRGPPRKRAASTLMGGPKATRRSSSWTFQTPVRVETPLGKKLLVLAVLTVAVILFVIEWVREYAILIESFAALLGI